MKIKTYLQKLQHRMAMAQEDGKYKYVFHFGKVIFRSTYYREGFRETIQLLLFQDIKHVRTILEDSIVVYLQSNHMNTPTNKHQD